eukprot:1160992-Pelagomonas_calceolata.AAC.4
MQSPVQQFCATCRSMGHAYCRISDLTSCRSSFKMHVSWTRFNLLLFTDACLMDQTQPLVQDSTSCCSKMHASWIRISTLNNRGLILRLLSKPVSRTAGLHHLQIPVQCSLQLLPVNLARHRASSTCFCGANAFPLLDSTFQNRVAMDGAISSCGKVKRKDLLVETDSTYNNAMNAN